MCGACEVTCSVRGTLRGAQIAGWILSSGLRKRLWQFSELAVDASSGALPAAELGKALLADLGDPIFAGPPTEWVTVRRYE